MNQSKKALYGLVGFPVKHSFSPAMHNAAFAAGNIPAEYKLFEVAPSDLEDFLLKRDDIIGFNITIPHKVEACKILQKNFPFSKESGLIQENLYYVKSAGAVNTVKRNAAGVDYYNTDASGFLRSLREDLGFSPEGKSVFLIGCGGAGRAVLAALSWRDAKVKNIYVYDNSKAAVISFKSHSDSLPDYWKNTFNQKVEFINPEQIPVKINNCQLLVNATPIGMKEGDPSPIDKNLFHKDLFVYDLVYNRDTELVKAARKICPGVRGGLGMLLYQGVEAWELWMPGRAPVDAMRKALSEEIKKKC